MGHVSNLHFSSNDQFLFANYGHHCISIFTLDGNCVGKLGTQGTARGQLNNPCGITTDMYSFILITGLGTNCASIFDKDGIVMHSLDQVVLVMVSSYLLVKQLLVLLVTFMYVRHVY